MLDIYMFDIYIRPDITVPKNDKIIICLIKKYIYLATKPVK